MERRPVCPAHTNYVKWFLITLITLHTVSGFFWIAYLKKIKKAIFLESPNYNLKLPEFIIPVLFWHNYMINNMDNAITLINIFNSNSCPSTHFIFQNDFISFHACP
jgi:hypothetical protein